MKSFFYNEEGIPIQSSLPVLAKDESDARNTMKLLSSYQFKEMDNKTIGIIIGIVVIIAIAAFFMSIFIYYSDVAEGYIVPAFSLGVAISL